MVNSEIPNFFATGELAETLRQARYYLSVEIGKKLYAGGHTEFAAMASQTWSTDGVGVEAAQKEFEELLVRTGASYPRLYLETLALEHVLQALRDLETQILSYFAAVATRLLNVADAIPTRCQLATRALEDILSVSVFRAPWGSAVLQEWQALGDSVRLPLNEILTKNEITSKSIVDCDVLSWQRCMNSISLAALSMCEGFAATLTCWERSYSTASSENYRPHEQQIYARTRATLQLRAQLQEDIKHFDSQQLFKMREKLSARDFLAACALFEGVVQRLKQVVNLFQQVDAKLALAPLREPVIAAQAYLYINAFCAKLRSLGEGSEAVAALEEAFFKYAIQSEVSCADVLDEEILKLSPTLRKESITRAKLEVRHHDVTYPLSVAYKDYVLATIKRATAPVDAPLR